MKKLPLELLVAIVIGFFLGVMTNMVASESRDCAEQRSGK